MANKNTSSETDTTDLLKSIENMLIDKLNPITDRLTTIEQSLTNLQQDVARISTIEENCNKQKKEIQFLKTELTKVKSKNKQLQEDLLRQESYSRRKNVRLHGISTGESQQDLEDVVIKMFGKIGVKIEPRDIERVHYIGQAKKGERRSVLLRFHHFKDKLAAISSKENLRQIHITIQEDFPKDIIERRKLLLPIFFKALELYPHLNPKFYGDKINLGGKIYTTENISTIQFPELHPETVFSPVKDGIQAFYTKYSPLSNFYPAVFEAERKKFPTA